MPRKRGDKVTEYRYTGPDVGNPPGTIKTGTVCSIREHVPADVTGAGDDTADVIVLEFTEPSLGVDDEGNPAIVTTTRAWAYPADSFTADFEEV